MDLQGTQQNRTERLIATARVLIAGFLLLAVTLNPSGPIRHAQVASVLGASFAGYALLSAAWAWRSCVSPGYFQFITHVLDLGVFLIFMHFTDGPDSIFFVSFGYSLASAALRWQWLGVLWTALAAMTAYSAVSIYAAKVLHSPAFDLNPFIIRMTYLSMAAVLLGCVGVYYRRQHSQMSMLAAWPPTAPQEVHTRMHHLLEHIAAIFAAPRVVMAWEEPEEPWLNLASWADGELHWTREPPGTFEPLVVQPLADANFLCQDSYTPVPTVLYTDSSSLQRWYGMPLHPNLQGRFAMGAFLSLSLRSEALEGRLFFADKRDMTADDLVLGGIIARKVAAELDQFYSFQEVREVAVTAERKRVARDLHDGLLQSMTGMNLQLEMVNRVLDNDPQAARAYLLEIQNLLVNEQRDLRFFVQELQQAPFSFSKLDFSLAARLEELSGRIQRQWDLHVESHLESPEIWIPRGLVPEIYSMIREALSNAARHAQASAVRVDLSVDDTHVRITVTDNGQGFPFHGRYDLTALTTLHLGPTTLKERIGSLGGSLVIDSTEAGATLHISLPLAPSGPQDTDSSDTAWTTRVWSLRHGGTPLTRH